jgi:hypothetical protein
MDFNNQHTMATVNYSVPDDVKKTFNRQFKGENKSAIIADLMRRAVENARIRDQRSKAIREILAFRERHNLPVLTDDEIRAARDEERS